MVNKLVWAGMITRVIIEERRKLGGNVNTINQIHDSGCIYTSKLFPNKGG